MNSCDALHAIQSTITDAQFVVTDMTDFKNLSALFAFHSAYFKNIPEVTVKIQRCIKSAGYIAIIFKANRFIEPSVTDKFIAVYMNDAFGNRRPAIHFRNGFISKVNRKNFIVFFDG